MTAALSEHGVRRPLGPAAELCCYRVIQEALTNAARHAPGSPVDVSIDYRDTEVALTIADRDPGVHRIRPTTNDAGYGLIGMRERVTALGGAVATARLDTGFRVEARIPIKAPEPIS